jgi:hypothetical protein
MDWEKAISTVILSLMLTLASFVIIKLPWIIEGEKEFITKPTAIRKAVNNYIPASRRIDTSFIRDHFLIINTTKDQMLTRDTSPNAGEAPGIPITDRRKLATLLRMCDEDTGQFGLVICDMRFELPSVEPSIDDTLGFYIGELERKEKFLAGVAYDGERREYDRSVFVFGAKSIAAASYDGVSENYYLHHELSYNNGSAISLPFLIYARHHHTKLRTTWIPNLVTYRGEGRSCLFFNSFIPEMIFGRSEFNNYEIDPEFIDENLVAYTPRKAICDLGKITDDSNGRSVLHDLLAVSGGKKDIFIGAINGRHDDIHNTLYGQLDGAIIVLNTYYCLERNYNRFYIWNMLMNLSVFLYISFRIVYGKRNEGQPPDSFWKLIRCQLKIRMYYVALVGLTVASYVFFNRETNLIALIILIEIIHGVVGYLRKYRIVKNQATEKTASK